MDRTTSPHRAPRPLPRHTSRADAGMAAAILLLGIFLTATGGFLVRRWQSASARQQPLSFEDQLGIAANTAGLIVITWWILTLAIAVLAALLDRLGRTQAAAAAGKFSPAFMRRLALTAVSLQLATAPLATAATAPEGPGDGRSAPPAASALWSPSPASAALPGPDPAVRALLPGQPIAPEPAPDPQGPVSGAGVDPRWKPTGPIVDAGPLTTRHVRQQDTADPRREITVRSGDSLWGITAAALGPFASDADIAREWPRIYGSNREAIGADPHLLRPGQVLVLPPGI